MFVRSFTFSIVSFIAGSSFTIFLSLCSKTAASGYLAARSRSLSESRYERFYVAEEGSKSKAIAISA
jgi:hypothetical protein